MFCRSRATKYFLILADAFLLFLTHAAIVTAKQTFRAIAFMGETVVFLYLGMAIFSFDHLLHPSLIIATYVGGDPPLGHPMSAARPEPLTL